jgi:hypothetical protein
LHTDTSMKLQNHVRKKRQQEENANKQKYEQEFKKHKMYRIEHVFPSCSSWMK